MARKSKTWEGTGAIIDIKTTPMTANNFADYVLNMIPGDVTYEFIMEAFGSFRGKSLAHAYDLIKIPKHTWVYTDGDSQYTNDESFITGVGVYTFNLIVEEFHFCRFFGGYINDNVNKKLFKKIDQTLTYALKEDDITVEEFKQWNNTVQWLMPFEDILSPNHTEKMVTITKAINKEKARLIKENKEAIEAGDVVVAEKIEKELLAFAKKYLGDDPSMDTILSGAGGVFENNFKNMYVMKGAIANPDPTAKQKYNIVTSNYMDGISAEEYSVVAGSGVAGAYSRAKKTETGGYWEKLFVRAYQHIKLLPKGSDCGTKRFVIVSLTEDNIKDWMYSYIIKSDGSLECLTSKNISKYVNKTVKFRFSSMCKAENGYICHKCAGDLLYDVAENIGMCMAQIPDTLKLRCMKGFHDSRVQTSKMNVMKAFYPFEKHNGKQAQG